MLMRMNYEKGAMEPIEVKSKNNIPIGTVLHLHGYNEPDFVIARNFGVNPAFPCHGASYLTIDLGTYEQGRHQASDLHWPSEGIMGIHTEITERVLPELDVMRLMKKSEALRVETEEKKARAEREYTELVEKGKALFAKHIPADAKALIVAERHVDECDSMTDYFHHSVKEVVILAWSAHTKDLFSEMRKAAAKIPETAHLGPNKGHFTAMVTIGADFYSNGSYYHKGGPSHWHSELDGGYDRPTFSTREEAQAHIARRGEPGDVSFEGQVIPFAWEIVEKSIEHREKYSMGSGYYLKDGGSHSGGWCVCKKKKYGDKWGDNFMASIARRCVFTDKEPAKVQDIVTEDGVTVTVNEDRNGIEIRFPKKPVQSGLDNLKANGWRWSRFGGCWYNRRNDQNMSFAESVRG